jgi:hypothetical protein
VSSAILRTLLSGSAREAGAVILPSVRRSSLPREQRGEIVLGSDAYAVTVLCSVRVMVTPQSTVSQADGAVVRAMDHFSGGSSLVKLLSL